MCRMEGEGLGDYITCGTCDVMSGRHMKGWCLMKSFKALPLSSVARQYRYCLLFNTNVAVPGRNQTLFRCVFRPHYRIQSAIAWNFH